MKKRILEKLLSQTKDELSAIEAAGESTASYARDGDVKSDGKYDTRGIEAGYLASAQLKRVEELKLEIQMLEEIPTRIFEKDEPVAIGALVDIEFNGQTRRYFVCSTAGGALVEVDGQAVLVISVFSPIGDGVLGLTVGEEFELETPQENRVYRVAGIS